MCVTIQHIFVYNYQLLINKDLLDNNDHYLLQMKEAVFLLLLPAGVCIYSTTFSTDWI